MDCGPPGSSIRGIFQARVLELGAIAFSAQVMWSPSKGLITSNSNISLTMLTNYFDYC